MTGQQGPTAQAAEARHQQETAAQAAARARKAARHAGRQRAARRHHAEVGKVRTRTLEHLLARERVDVARRVAQRRAELDRLSRVMSAHPEGI